MRAGLCVLASAALVSAQLPLAPTSVSVATTDDKSITVAWTPASSDGATGYDVTAKVVHPFPETQPTLTVSGGEEFSSSTLSSAYSFSASTCPYGSSTYACWLGTGSGSVDTATGTFKVVTLPYQYTPTTWYNPPSVSTKSEYGRNGVPWLQREVTGEFSAAAADKVYHTRLTQFATSYVPSTYTYFYNQAGFIVYDLNPGDLKPRWVMQYYCYYLYKYSTTNTYWYVYGKYVSAASSNLLTYYMYSTTVSFYYNTAPVDVPIDLYVTRSNAASSWNFAYAFNNGPVTKSSTVWTDSMFTQFGWSRDNLRIGLYQGEGSAYTCTGYFDFFRVYNKVDFDAYADWQAYWSGRNSSILANGVCGVSRDVTRRAPAGATSFQINGLLPGTNYSISVTAVNANGASGRVVGPFASAALTLPVSGATVHLDANTIPATTTAVSYWPDMSGSGSHFSQTTASLRPTLVKATKTAPWQSLSFSGSQELRLDNPAKESLFAMASDFSNHAFTFFVLMNANSNNYYGGLWTKGCDPYANAVGWQFYAYRSESSGGNTIGVRVAQNNNAGAAMGFKIPRATHPYDVIRAPPTLITAIYNKVPATTQKWKLDMCTGLNEGLPTDDCSSPAPSVTSTVTKWAASAADGYSFYDSAVYTHGQGAPYNTYDYNAAGITTFAAHTAPLVIGGTWYTSSTWDKFAGNLYSVVHFQNRALTQPEILSVQNFLYDRFNQRCPGFGPSTGMAAGSVGCPSALQGATCALSCDVSGAVSGTKYYRYAGAGSLRCWMGSWVGKGIACAPRCPTISAPPDVGDCTRTFVNEDFQTYPLAGSNFTALQMWDTAPQVTYKTALQYWSVVRDGVTSNMRLRGSAPLVEDSCSVTDPTGLFVAQSTWVDTMSLTSPLDSAVDVYLGAGVRGGLLFRVANNLTYYRFSVQGAADSMRLEKVVNGVASSPVLWRNTTSVFIRNDFPYRLRAVAKAISATNLNSLILVYIDSTLVFNITDGDIPTGSAGVYVESGVAFFDNFAIKGDCDSGGSACKDLSVGQSCAFTCAAGYTMSGGVAGVSTRSCITNGTISGVDVDCVPQPPTFRPHAFNISEDAPVDTVAGTLNSTAVSPRHLILYYLDAAGNTETVKDRFGVVKGTVADVFRVGLCSGTIELNKGGTLSYDTNSRVFTLTVRACANGRLDACTAATVTVTVLNAISPPYFEADVVSPFSATNYARSIDENSKVGTIVRYPIVAYNPEGNSLLYRISYGDPSGAFAIFPNNGSLYVAKAVLDFETQPAYNMIVEAKDAIYTNNTATVYVTVSLNDINDPPTAAVPQGMQIIEDLAKINTFAGTVLVADQDKPETISYSLLYPSTNFSVDATGRIKFLRTFSYDRETADVFVIDGLLCREVFNVTVLAKDSRNASVIVPVNIYILANATSATRPIANTVTPPNMLGMRTAGGETLTIKGTNFNTIINVASATAVQVQLVAQASDPYPGRVYNCTAAKVIADDIITCTTPTGFGANLAVVVRWGNTKQLMQSTNALLVSYRKPIVTATTAYSLGLPSAVGGIADVAALYTQGGDYVALTGTDFGPIGTPVRVRYGNTTAGWDYEGRVVTYPNVTTANTRIVFITAEGYGSGLYSRVIVGNQESAPATYGMKYDWAQVLNFTFNPTTTPQRAINTLNGLDGKPVVEAVVTGYNFGPSWVIPNTWYRTYTARNIMIDNVTSTAKFEYRANCRKPSGALAHTTMYCSIPPGVSAYLLVATELGGVTYQATILAKGYSYAPPTISSITGAGSRIGDTAGGQQVILTGSGFGPVGPIGTGAPGYYGTTPLSATYGPTGLEYLARDCRVISNVPNQISCMTTAGTGKNHRWKLYVADQYVTTSTNVTSSYGPPIITSFERMELDTFGQPLSTSDFPTTGGSGFRIRGRNFGAAIIPEKFAATYTVTIAKPTTQYGTVLGDPPGRVTFTVTAASCTMTVPHAEIVCSTVEGAGKDASVSLIIDGQSSITPTISYGAPVVSAIQKLDGSPATSMLSDGGEVVRLIGMNFGPSINCRASTTFTGGQACVGYVQRVRYGFSGLEYAPIQWHVVSDTELQVRLLAGYGQDLYFTVQVADQVGEGATATFSFAPPTITSIAPATGRTQPSAFAPQLMTITGRNFGLLDRTATVSILFGNPTDNTVLPAIAPVSRLPDLSRPSTVTAHTAGDDHVLTFYLPEGLAQDRAIRVMIGSASNPADPVSISDPIADGSLFDYITPNIEAVVVEAPPRTGNSTRANAIDSLIKINFREDQTVVLLTLLGSNFGPDVSVLGDNVGRRVEYAPLGSDTTNPAVWGTADLVLVSWTHNRVEVLTSAGSGVIRANIMAAPFDSFDAVPLYSNEYSYIDMSPAVTDIVGGTGPFDSRGGAIVGFKIKYMLSLTTNMTAKVGGRTAEIVKLDGSVVDPNSVRNELILNPAYYTTPGQTTGFSADTVWTLYIRLPEGEGRNQPLVISRDGVPSNDGVTISYKAPTITSFDVMQRDGSWQSFTYLYGVYDTINVPTEGTRIRIFGSDFGLCPQILMGNGDRAQLGPEGTICNDLQVANSSYASHTELEFDSAPGEGLGYYLAVVVGGQSSATDSAQPINFNYLPPEVVTVTPEGSTRGGTMINITGFNFGINRPSVSIGGTSCNWVTRYSHFLLGCRLSEGSGKDLDVTVTVATQVGTLPRGFHYSLPVITRVWVTTTPYTGAIDWPQWNWTTNTTSNSTTEGITYNVTGGEMPVGPSAGGYHVVVFGSNFGRQDLTKHCLFISWAARDRARTMLCNDREDFLGEGEVPHVAIVYWSHTFVQLVFPPGHGVKEIVPFVNGQTPATPVEWRYNVPTILEDLVPNHGPTDGGTALTIVGKDLGMAPLVSNADVAAVLFPRPTITSITDMLARPPAPMAAMLVSFWRGCVSTHKDLMGNTPVFPGFPTCEEAISSHTDGNIVFRSAGGIGVNRSVSVVIIDRRPSAADPAVLEQVELRSNAVLFSYDAPYVQSTAPRPVLMDGTVPKYVTLSGINFGTQALATQQGWTAEESAISVSVGGIPTLSSERVSRLGYDVVDVSFGVYPVGYHNLTYYVAGQRGFTNDTDYGAVMVGCQPGFVKDYRKAEFGPNGGFFGREGETCLPCPIGAVCRGFDPNMRVEGTQSEIDGGTHTYPIPVKGWYNLNSSDLLTSGMYDACPEEMMNAYPGRDVCIVPCEPPEACEGNNQCNEAYSSKAPYFRCASCATGFYKRANECVRCPNSPYALVIGFLMLVMFGGAAAYILNKKKINLAFVAIGVDYFQILAIFALSKVAWPAAIKELFHILSAFNLNIEIVAPECLVPDLGWKRKWMFIMALPFSLSIFFAILMFSGVAYKKFVMGRKVKMANAGSGLASSVLMLMYILYIYLTRNVLDVFNCTPTDPPDGKTYLSAVFEQCGVPGGSQMTLMPAAVIAVIVYIIGYPSFVVWLLYTNRELVMEDQLLRAKCVGDDRLTNPHAYGLRKRWNRLYYQFKPDQFLWVFAIIIRKFCIAATYILFNKNASFQLAAALLVVLLAYSAQVRYNPYMSPQDFEEVLKDHERKCFTSPVHARLRATLAGIETRGRKKVRRNLLNAEGNVEFGAVLGLLRGWLFNYNTVESIMLFSAVVVALMGLMFSAQDAKKSYYASARDAVTAVVIGVVALSIVYFVTVFVTEIVILASENNRRKAAARKAAASAKSESKSGKSPKAGKTDPDAEFEMGDVTSAMNPMFMTAAKSAVAESVTADDAGLSRAVEAIQSMRQPPSNELWSVYQNSYSELLQRVETLRRTVDGFSPEVKAMIGQPVDGAATPAEGGPSAGTTPSASSPSPAVKRASSTPAVDNDAVPIDAASGFSATNKMRAKA